MTTERVLPPVRLGRDLGLPAPAVAAAPPTAARRGGDRATLVPAASSALRSAQGRGRTEVLDPKASARPTGIAPTARLAKGRGIALHSTATRAGMLVGVSAAVYAVSLATVAALESQTQAQAAADAAPALSALAITTTLNDEMDAAIKDASARLTQLAHDYDSTSTDMSAYQARFDQLSALVAKIQGSAAAMNANFKLPTVTVRGAVGSGGGGTVVTTTAASGKP